MNRPRSPHSLRLSVRTALLAVSLCPMLLACGGGGRGARDARPVEFDEPEQMFILPFEPGEILIGNFEDDTVWSEMIVQGREETAIEFHANNLQGGFESTLSQRVDLQELMPDGSDLEIRQIMARDLNDDTLLDLLVLTARTGEVVAFLNQDHGMFSAEIVANPTAGARGFALGNFNTDALPDLIVATDSVVQFHWREANALRWRDSRSTVSIGSGIERILAGDFMLRQSDEMMAVGSEGIQLIRRNRNRVFVPDDVQRLDVEDAAAVITPDLNGDGFLDIAVARTDRGEVGLWLTDVDREWVANRPDAIEISSPVALESADLGGDGRMDLVVGTRATGRTPAALWVLKQRP